MKLSFKKLPSASNGKVQVSLDGGNTFEEHDVQSIKSAGIPLSDGQDYSKIRIKGNTELLKNLEVISKVSVYLEHEEPDYDTRIEWYSWKSDDGEIIFTKTDDKTQDCIIYKKQPVDKAGHYDYFEVSLGSRTTFSWTDDGIVKSWAGGPGIQTYLYSRFPIGDVVVKEPKKIDFYSWGILKGRIAELDGILINPGIVVGTLYTTKNPEEENGPFIFYSIGDNDEVSIEFIQKSVGREFPFAEFKGQYCIYKDSNCIMFSGGVGKQLSLDMASVPVETVKTPLYSKKDNNYYAWKTPSGLVCYTRTLNPFEDLKVYSLVLEDIVSPETYIPKFESATGEATMFGNEAIFTWQNGTLHYYNDMVKGDPEEYDLQRYEDGDKYLPQIITINPPTWFDMTDPLSSIVPKGEYIIADGHKSQSSSDGQTSIRDLWKGFDYFINNDDDCTYEGIEISSKGIAHLLNGQLHWSDLH